MRDEDKRFTGGPAFPVVECDQVHGTRVECGMTLRDWFAGMAMSGLLCADEFGWKSEDLALQAYDHADAMLLLRKGE